MHRTQQGPATHDPHPKKRMEGPGGSDMKDHSSTPQTHIENWICGKSSILSGHTAVAEQIAEVSMRCRAFHRSTPPLASIYPPIGAAPRQ